MVRIEGEVSWHWIPDKFCLKQLSCPARVAGSRGKPFPQALAPHLGWAAPWPQGRESWISFWGPSLSLERIQIWKQPWQNLWLHSCPVSWPFVGEVPAMLFNMCPSLSRWKENAQSAEQPSRLRSKKLCGARHIISYVSWWWRLQKLVANTGNSLQGNLEALNNSSLCAYCGSTVSE